MSFILPRRLTHEAGDGQKSAGYPPCRAQVSILRPGNPRTQRDFSNHTPVLPDNREFFPRAFADRAAFVFLFGLRGVAADRADVELARRANPRLRRSTYQERDRFTIEP